MDCLKNYLEAGTILLRVIGQQYDIHERNIKDF